MTAGIVGAPRVSRGQTFGRLRVVGFADTTNRDGPRLVACRCACGRERQTNARNLTSGRVRACPLLGTKFVLLGHNTIRGAAGASILNAELFKVEGLLPV